MLSVSPHQCGRVGRTAHRWLSHACRLQALGDGGPRISLKRVRAAVQHACDNGVGGSGTQDISLGSFLDIMSHDDTRLHSKSRNVRLGSALTHLEVWGRLALDRAAPPQQRSGGPPCRSWP